MDCLRSFRTSEYEAHKNRNPVAVEGTCQWILENLAYQNWFYGNDFPLLWISADPGFGKSVLSRFLVDRKLGHAGQTICYFFFKDDDDEQKTVANALSAILHQLFSAERLLLEHAKDEFTRSGDKLSINFYLLWDILLEATSDKGIERVVCVLDGLDECPKKERNILLDALQSLNCRARELPTCRLLFLLTSRPYLELRNGIENFAHIRLRGEDESTAISQEINLVIDFRVGELKDQGKLTSELGNILRKRLRETGNRTYLWLHLIFEELEKGFKKTRIGLHRLVNELPSSVDAAYEKILSQTKNRDRTFTILSIIIAATRPLTLQEMQIASEINLEYKTLEELDLEREEDFEVRLRNDCGLFVSIQDQRVYLIHQTAKEFLVSNDVQIELTPQSDTVVWRNSVDLIRANALLGEKCVACLLLEQFQNASQIGHYIDSFAFLQYSGSHWLRHTRQGHIFGKPNHAYARLCAVYSVTFKTWFTIWWNFEFKVPPPQNLTHLLLASIIKDRNLAIYGLDNQDDIEATDDTFGRTALSWASYNFDEEIIQLLLDNGADTEKTVRLLLGRGFAEDKLGDTGLHVAAAGLAAISNNHKENITLFSTSLGRSGGVVRILLKFGADINAKNVDNETVLFGAILSERLGMVQLLLAAGVDINVVNSEGRTAVMEALHFFGTKWDSVKCLLDAGANVTDGEKEAILRRARGVDRCDTKTDRLAKIEIVKMLEDGD